MFRPLNIEIKQDEAQKSAKTRDTNLDKNSDHNFRVDHDVLIIIQNYI